MSAQPSLAANGATNGVDKSSAKYYVLSRLEELGNHAGHAETRSEALKLTQGQTAHIPDINKTVTKDWPVGCHPDVEKLREEIDGWLVEMAKSKEELQGLLDSDIAGFAAWWAPGASWDKVRWVAYYLAWLFLWDDNFEAAVTSGNASSAQLTQQHSLDYISKTLQANASTTAVPIPDSSDTTTRSLLHAWTTHIATPLLLSQPPPSPTLLDSLSAEITTYLHALTLEAHFTSRPVLPSIPDYWRYRKGCISLRFLLAATQHTSGIPLAARLAGSPALEALHAAATEHVFLANDVLSGYKEVRNADVSLLGILCARTGSMQGAVDIAVGAVGHAARALEDAAGVLRQEAEALDMDAGGRGDVVRELVRYVDAVRASCAGNVEWSVRTKRYMLEPFADGDCGFDVRFEGRAAVE